MASRFVRWRVLLLVLVVVTSVLFWTVSPLSAEAPLNRVRVIKPEEDEISQPAPPTEQPPPPAHVDEPEVTTDAPPPAQQPTPASAPVSLEVKGVPSLQQSREQCPKDYDKHHAIVTACSSSHFHTIQLLILTITQHEPCITLIVYDLGFEPHEVEHLKGIKGHPGPYFFRRFEYEKYPPYFNVTVAAGEYAWKAVIVADVLKDYQYVAWMDSGDLLHSPLTPLFEYLDSAGFYSSGSSGNIQDWTHRGTIDYLKADWESCRYMQNCNAAFLGFKRDTAYSQLAIPWRDCSAVKACVAPDGSSRGNHRQDQAALTVLVCMSHGTFRCGGSHIDGLYQIQLDSYVHNIISKFDLFQVPLPASLGAAKEQVCKGSPLANCRTPERYPAAAVLGFLLTYTTTITTSLNVGLYGPQVARNIGLLSAILGPSAAVTLLIPAMDEAHSHFLEQERPPRSPRLAVMESKGISFGLNAIYFEDLPDDGDSTQHALALASALAAENWLVVVAKTSRGSANLAELASSAEAQLAKIIQRDGTKGTFTFEEDMDAGANQVAITFLSHQHVPRY